MTLTEDKLSGPYFSMTYDSKLEDITLTAYNVEEEDKEKAIKDAFDYIEGKYGKDVFLSDNRIVFETGVPDDEKFEIIDLLTDYKPFQTEELEESVNKVEEDSTQSIEWEDLSGADQAAVGFALDEIRYKKTNIEDAVRFWCDEIASANFEMSGYDEASFEEPDYDKVLAYVQQELTLTEVDECTNPSSIPNIPGKHVNLNWKYKEDADDRLELDENTTYRVMPCEWGFELPKTIKTKIRDTLRKYLGNTKEMRDTYRNIIDDRLINIYGNYDSDMDYELNTILKPYVKALATEDVKRYSDFVPYEDREYWYFTKHGVQPGSIPRGVNVLDIIDIPNGSYVCLDAALNTSELKQYDLIEMAPDENEILGIENYYDTMFANQEFEDETRAFTSKLDRSTYESLQLREDAWEDGPCSEYWGNAGMNTWYDEETGEYYTNDYLDHLSMSDLRDRDPFFPFGDGDEYWDDDEEELEEEYIPNYGGFHCPKCGSNEYYEVDDDCYDDGDYEIQEFHYKCAECGYESEKDSYTYEDDEDYDDYGDLEESLNLDDYADYHGEWLPYDPICPDCGTPLKFTPYYSYCPTCDVERDYERIPHDLLKKGLKESLNENWTEIRPRQSKTDTWYEYSYWNDANGGFGFPCDENGCVDVDSLPKEARKNYEYCTSHQDEFQSHGWTKYDNTYNEPALVKCSNCGTEFNADMNGWGEVECPECGQLYNGFGQELARRGTDVDWWDAGEEIYPDDDYYYESLQLKEAVEEDGVQDTEQEYDNTFGDASDIPLTGDVDKDFETVVNYLRSQDYSELGEALDEIVKDPKLYELLSKGFGEGDLAKVKMSSGTTTIAASQLLPSQSEIGLDNSLAYPLKSDCHSYFKDAVTIVAPIITYRKTFIIDGHHRWSQALMINPNVKMNAINFNYEEESPYRALRNFQGAIAVTNRDVPSQESKVNNVYEMSEDQIREYVENNIQNVCVESLVDVGVAKDKQGVIDYIVNNAMQLKSNNPPFANAPDREYMPQTDDASIQTAAEGQTNI